MREILETFQEQSQLSSKSALKSGIIQADIHRLNNQFVEDCTRFAEDNLSLSAVEVNLESLIRIEKDFRQNLVDASSTFDKMSLLNSDGTNTEIIVLNWIEETKINLRQIKAKLETKEKVKADSIKF